MSMVEYQRWELAAKKKRWEELRKVLSQPWNGDRGWEGRTIGLHLPVEIRNAAVRLQERLGLRSMKEVLFKALIVGLRQLEELPVVPSPVPDVRVVRTVVTTITHSRKGRPLDIEEGILEETDIDDFSGEDEPEVEPQETPEATPSEPPIA